MYGFGLWFACLLFATLLTLVLLPCMFLTMFDLRLIKIPSTTNPTEEITTTITTTAAN